MRTLVILLFINNFSYSQELWTSQKWSYQLEIPSNFSLKSAVGANVDFKAADKLGASVVITVVAFPEDYKNVTIVEVIGDTLEYRKEFLKGGYEYFDELIFLKSGWTTLSNRKTFWFDYSEGSPNLLHKVYSLVKNGALYTINLTCDTSSKGKYDAIWYRFKNKIEL